MTMMRRRRRKAPTEINIIIQGIPSSSERGAAVGDSVVFVDWPSVEDAGGIEVLSCVLSDVCIVISVVVDTVVLLVGLVGETVIMLNLPLTTGTVIKQKYFLYLASYIFISDQMFLRMGFWLQFNFAVIGLV